jgi:hypothetical protein
MTARMPVLMAAQAVALAARTGTLRRDQVDDMRTKAEELLARDDPFRSAVILFATHYEGNWRDRVAVADLGEELQRNVLRATEPPPPLTPRSDLDG